MLKGTTWVFNTVLDFDTVPPPIGYTLYTEEGLFTCDGDTYYGISFLVPLSSETVESMNYKTSYSQSVSVYNNNNSTWTDNKYKTITFINEIDLESSLLPSSVGEQFEAWLSANAEQKVLADPYASYVVTGAALSSIADAIRAKNGDSSELIFPTGFVDAIESIRGLKELTADANATAEYIHMNKTAYVNGEKITGTGKIIRIRQVTKSWPSTSATVPAGGCIKQTLLFQGADTSSMKGIDTITTTATSSISALAEFSYNQNTSSGVRRINMFFNNLTNNSIYVPSYAFTSIATIIY